MYKPFDLTGRKALITGGNGGIGLGMAKALLQAGADVAIWGSNPEKTNNAVKQPEISTHILLLRVLVSSRNMHEERTLMHVERKRRVERKRKRPTEKKRHEERSMCVRRGGSMRLGNCVSPYGILPKRKRVF